MIEKQVEQALRKAVRDRGGLALKFVSPGLAGVPDRIVLMPNRRVAFVELKAPGKHPRPLQVKRKRQLESLEAEKAAGVAWVSGVLHRPS